MKKVERFADGQLQNFVNVLAVIADLEHGALEARAAAFFADEFDVGEELHLDGDGAVALAGFAAAAGNVEGKMAGGVAAALGVGRVGEDFADGVEGFEVGGGIRARRAADGRLIDDDDFADFGVAFDAVAEFLDAGAVALGGERFVEDVVDDRGFAGAADAGDNGERSERNHQIDILQIVDVRAEEAQEFSVGLVAAVRDGDAEFAAEIAAGDGFRLAQHRVVGAGEEQLAAEFAGAGAEIDDASRRLRWCRDRARRPERCCRDRGEI